VKLWKWNGKRLGNVSQNLSTLVVAAKLLGFRSFPPKYLFIGVFFIVFHLHVL